MAEFENRGFSQARSTAAQTAGYAVDEGLRSYMLRVYNYMALGVAFTAIVVLVLMLNPSVMMALAPLQLLWFGGILLLGFLAPRLIFSGSAATAHACFWGYAALWGIAITPLVYFSAVTIGPGIVVKALAITSVMFGATSLYGYVTKRDLSPLGTFFFMASIGLILVMLVNAFFIGSTFMQLLTSGGVVLLFAGVTAYETQMIKEFYVSSDGQAVVQQKAIMGAFLLYGSFVTLFIHILNILRIFSNN